MNKHAQDMAKFFTKITLFSLLFSSFLMGAICHISQISFWHLIYLIPLGMVLGNLAILFYLVKYQNFPN